MLEFKSSVHAVKKWEEYLDALSDTGLVTILKEPVKVDGVDVSSSEYDLEKIYQLFVKPHDLDEGGPAHIRLWRDERTNKNGFKANKASVKFHDKALKAILNSVTVVTILAKHNIRLIGNNGKIDLKALTEAAKLIDKDIVAIEKVEDGKFIVKTDKKE
jgi:hypothetical protein